MAEPDRVAAPTTTTIFLLAFESQPSSSPTPKPSPPPSTDHNPQAATMPTPAPGGSPATELVEYLLAEIFFRLPPDEPECLVRAAAVCKPWRCLISDPAFLRRYRKIHRAPPLLGFLRQMPPPSRAARFVPFTEFRPLDPDQGDCYPLDCRHGRALLYDENSSDLILWDPMTGEKKHIREPGIRRTYFNTAVLCARANCDHLDCHGGPFLVAFVGTNDEDAVAQALLYSSETDTWSTPAFVQNDYYMDVSRPPVLAGEALYFIGRSDDTILRYDLVGGRDLSIITQPTYHDGGNALIPSEDGELWFVGLDKFTLYLWTMVATTGPEEDDMWERRRIIRLDGLSISHPFHRPLLIGTAKGPDSGIVFVSLYAGVFMIDLESKWATKVFERDYFDDIFPYMSFCTPVRHQGATAGEQGVVAANDMPSKGLEDGVTALRLEAS